MTKTIWPGRSWIHKVDYTLILLGIAIPLKKQISSLSAVLNISLTLGHQRARVHIWPTGSFLMFAIFPE